MYRVALESILGIQFNGNSLLLNPTISESWEGFRVDLLLDDQATKYHIEILNPDKLQTGLLTGKVDGVEAQFDEAPAKILLYNDGKQHHIRLSIIQIL
jgi:cyclic beta-1,2-glucan synthetase